MKFTAAQIATGYGRLITSMDDVYLVMNHMTGDNLYTHQLPRALRASQASMLEQHPWLAEVDGLVDYALETNVDKREAMDKVIRVLNHSYGTELELIPLDEWIKQNPILELVDIMDAR